MNEKLSINAIKASALAILLLACGALGGVASKWLNQNPDVSGKRYAYAQACAYIEKEGDVVLGHYKSEDVVFYEGRWELFVTNYFGRSLGTSVWLTPSGRKLAIFE